MDIEQIIAGNGWLHSDGFRTIRGHLISIQICAQITFAHPFDWISVPNVHIVSAY
ncbi:hypothetical protein D3C80_1893360 [compost metagenome]